MNIPGGFIILSKKIQESEIWFKPDCYLKIFIYILLSVSYKKTSILERGEGLFIYNTIIEDCQVRRGSLDHFVRWGKSAGIIATRRTTKGVFIKVLHYAEYQDLKNYKKDHKCDTKCGTGCGRGAVEVRQHSKRSNNIITKDINNSYSIPQGEKAVDEKKTIIKKKEKKENPEAVRLSKGLLNCIRYNNPNFKSSESTIPRWSEEIEKMIRIDKRNPLEIEQVIRYAQADTFWKGNILSAAKLRIQFDQLWIKLKEKKQKTEIPDYS